ncbi:MAG: glycosyltransferase family 4 protein [Chloroflexi bacterium]|nr:glycosyltransferase family 4 protein [Chloroflexota bacterium]
MRRINVLLFYPNDFLGPEVTIFAQIIRHLDRARFDVTLVMNSAASGALHVDETSGVTVRRWNFGQTLGGSMGGAIRSIVQLIGGMTALVRYARAERVDIVQVSSTPRAAILGLLLARLVGAKLVVHYHVLPGRFAGPRRFLENLVSRRADYAVGVSRFLAATIPSTGMNPTKIGVVVNGVDLDKFTPTNDGTQIRAELGIPADAPLVLQLARIIQQKRQSVVVQAFARARREVPDLRCLLVGWEDPRYTGSFPSYAAELRHIAEAEGLGDSLIIAPARPDAPAVVAAADIIVMPSIGDAWNLAVTEAMATAKPVIGAASGGIPEQIVDGVTGFLVPPDAPEALADKMVVLGRDAELRAQMGRAARERAEACFGEARVAEGFAPIYTALAERPQRGAK